MVHYKKSFIELFVVTLILVSFKINLPNTSYYKKLNNIEDYLATGENLNLDQLNLIDWEKLPGISTAKALKIIDSKPKNCADLYKIKGLSKKQLQEIFKLLSCKFSKE